MLPLLLALSSLVQSTTPLASDAIVASANGVTVSAAELQQVVRRVRLTGDPTLVVQTMTADGLSRIARQLAERKLLAALARQRGLAQQIDIAQAIERAAVDILADMMVERETASVDTSPAALRRYYDEHQDDFRTGPRRKTRHIVVATRDDAEAILKRLAAGERFEAIAAEKNTDATKSVSGDLGWVPRGVMVKPFEDAVFVLDKPGQTSGVIETSFGFHVARVEEVDAGSLAPFELAQDRVKQVMQERAIAKLKASLVETHPITIDQAALDIIAKGKR